MSKDPELLRRYARDQDPEAFAELVDRYAGLVYRACARITGNAQDAEDASQECFMALARNAGSIAAPLPAWLYVTAANRARNVLRSSTRRKRREAVAATRAEADGEPGWQDIEPHVDAALLEIPEALRLPIVLCYLEKMTQTEAAAELGVDRSTVSRRLNRGIEELRKKLRRVGVAMSTAVVTALLAEQATAAVPATLEASLAKMALAGVGRAPMANATVHSAWRARLATVTAVSILAIAGVMLARQLADQPPKSVLPAKRQAKANPGKEAAPVMSATHTPHDALDTWPMPRHDTRLTGRSALRGKIEEPRILCRHSLGAARCAAAWVEDIDGDGQLEILTGEAQRLQAATCDGDVKWNVPTSNVPVVAVADLDDDGAKEIVLRGPEIRSALDGRLLWRPSDASARHEYRIYTGPFLPELKGQQIATMTMHGFDLAAHVYTFQGGADRGETLWERTFQTSIVGDYGPAMISDVDQDGNLELCAAVVGGFVALDLRTGEEKLRLEWEVEGHKRRNYGQVAARDIDGDGSPEALLVNAIGPLQMAALKIRDDQASMLWNHYWGEGYPEGRHLLHLVPLSICDLDGDGGTEIALSLYEHGKGWNLQIHSAQDGSLLAQHPGLYVESVLQPDGAEPAYLVASEQRTLTPARFSTLHGLVYRDRNLRGLWRRDDAHLEGPLWERRASDFGCCGALTMDQRRPIEGDWDRDGRSEFVIAVDADRDGRADRIEAIAPRPDGAWERSVQWTVDPADDLAVLAASPLGAGDAPALLVAGARGHVWWLDREGNPSERCFAGGTFFPTPVVADIDGDGANEIIVGSSDGLMNAVKVMGREESPQVQWSYPGWGTFGHWPGSESAVLADLDGDGRQEVLVGIYERGQGAGLACLAGDGKPVWKWFWPGEVSGAEIRPIRGWTVGRFSGQDRLDVFVATRLCAQMSGGMTQENWVLNGRDGTVLWHRKASDIPDFYYKTLGPSDLPSVWDVNGDGADDVLTSSLASILVLAGKTGTPLCPPIYPTQVVGDGSKSQWTAYGSLMVQDLDGRGRPAMILTASIGAWGAMTLDGERIWSIPLGHQVHCMRHGALADVDGDGRLELGMPHPQGFRCYDVATGELKWQLSEPGTQTDVVAADIDDDGMDEFLVGMGNKLMAIKGEQDTGRVLWTLDLGSVATAPIVADINGDGLAEILVGTADGHLNVIGR